MSLTKLSLVGNNDVIYKLFPPRESLVSDIPAGDGNIKSFFTVYCRRVWEKVICLKMHYAKNFFPCSDFKLSMLVIEKQIDHSPSYTFSIWQLSSQLIFSYVSEYVYISNKI
jgi:hypothetical protein